MKTLKNILYTLLSITIFITCSNLQNSTNNIRKSRYQDFALVNSSERANLIQNTTLGKSDFKEKNRASKIWAWLRSFATKERLDEKYYVKIGEKNLNYNQLKINSRYKSTEKKIVSVQKIKEKKNILSKSSQENSQKIDNLKELKNNLIKLTERIAKLQEEEIDDIKLDFNNIKDAIPLNIKEFLIFAARNGSYEEIDQDVKNALFNAERQQKLNIDSDDSPGADEFILKIRENCQNKNKEDVVNYGELLKFLIKGYDLENLENEKKQRDFLTNFVNYFKTLVQQKLEKFKLLQTNNLTEKEYNKKNARERFKLLSSNKYSDDKIFEEKIQVEDYQFNLKNLYKYNLNDIDYNKLSKEIGYDIKKEKTPNFKLENVKKILKFYIEHIHLITELDDQITTKIKNLLLSKIENDAQTEDFTEILNQIFKELTKVIRSVDLKNTDFYLLQDTEFETIDACLEFFEFTKNLDKDEEYYKKKLKVKEKEHPIKTKAVQNYRAIRKLIVNYISFQQLLVHLYSDNKQNKNVKNVGNRKMGKTEEWRKPRIVLQYFINKQNVLNKKNKKDLMLELSSNKECQTIVEHNLQRLYTSIFDKNALLEKYYAENLNLALIREIKDNIINKNFVDNAIYEGFAKFVDKIGSELSPNLKNNQMNTHLYKYLTNILSCYVGENFYQEDKLSLNYILEDVNELGVTQELENLVAMIGYIKEKINGKLKQELQKHFKKLKEIINEKAHYCKRRSNYLPQSYLEEADHEIMPHSHTKGTSERIKKIKGLWLENPKEDQLYTGDLNDIAVLNILKDMGLVSEIQN